MTEINKINFSFEEAAKYLGVSVSSVKRLRENGELKCSRLGKRVLFRKARLDELLESKEAA
jgi:excisionase family DNA binding protein